MNEFLDWLWAPYSTGYFAELRVLGRYPRQHYFYLPLEVGDLVVQAKADDWAGNDVYIGVLPRTSMDGHSSSVSRYTRVVWADVDSKKHGGSKDHALGAILDFSIPPSVIVDSGHGFHCYWGLKGGIDFEYHARLIMKGIANILAGDQVHDAARILRLPGTHNHKDGESVPVRLIRLDTTLTYGIADFDEFKYIEPKMTKWTFGTTPVTPHSWVVTDWDKPIDFGYDPGKGARSEHDFGVVAYLVEHGWEDSEIENVFLNNPTGVGAKTAKSGIGYLRRTIRKARAGA